MNGSEQVRYYRDRGEAIKRFVRRFRHEISTPLSGAALHLEVASRRLQKEDGFDRGAVLENLRVSQQALESASQMLDWIGDFSRGDDAVPAEIALGAVVAEGAEPFREDLRRRGLALELPPDSGGPHWFGSAHELAQVVSELTANAFQHASAPGAVRWLLVADGSSPLLSCESPGRLPEGDPEHLFGSAKGTESTGRGFGLLRARRLAQSNGAELTLAQAGGNVRATLRFLAESA
jgi:C4-dicarboxylate-specific signal transduction histidine kinase